MVRAVLLLAGLAAPPAGAAEPAIEGVREVRPHTLVRLRLANAPARAAVRWDVTPSAGVDFAAPTRNAREVVWVAPPGRYAVRALVVGPVDKDGVPSLDELRAEVVIGEPTPPAPPTPPGPKPGPDDQLRARLRAAFAADTVPPTAPERDEVRKDLAALWRKGAAICRSPDIQTVAELNGKMREAATLMIGADALPGTRAAIRDVVAAELSADVELDDAARGRAAALFGRISQALNW